MADTLEEICNVSLNLTQLKAGYTLFDLPATDGFVIRDIYVSNPGNRKVQLLRNGAAFRTLDYSTNLSGFEIVPKDATMSLSTSVNPIFNRFQSMTANQVVQSGGVTIFDDAIPVSNQNASIVLAPYTANAVYQTVSTSFSGNAFQFCLVAAGNFYYCDANGSGGNALYRRAGGFNGAETTLWSGTTIANATYDQATGILYAIQVGGSVWKRYDTINSVALADVALPTGLTGQGAWSANTMSFTAYNNVLYCSIVGTAVCHIVSGVTSTYTGSFALSTTTPASARPQFKFSKNRAGEVYFVYVASSSVWQVFTIVGNNPATVPTVSRTVAAAVSIYNTGSPQRLVDIPGTDWMVGYDTSSIQLLNPANLQFFTVTNFSLSNFMIQQGIDTAAALTDFGQIGVRMTGVRFN
ncbi:hypothetical protein [Caulobacter sp. UC70_42]|uniref:hypothetical protein n=1 Tax=Caulobacter sp. UC70_42 TaxID=3374551 RepID=UPI003757C8C2